MTEDQIERAARALCRMRGLDPDEMVGHDAPVGPGWYQPAVMLSSPRWEFFAHEIRAALQIQQAIKEACEPEERPDVKLVGEPQTLRGTLKLQMDLREAKELLDWAARFMRSAGAFGIAGDNRDELVTRIQRFLDRKDT